MDYLKASFLSYILVDYPLGCDIIFFNEIRHYYLALIAALILWKPEFFSLIALQVLRMDPLTSTYLARGRTE